ncbi:WcaF family extracellular polysaccharide biosynthesis acetyltransferase [Desertivirga xinjiangensis]|uniref:WcaF family extracellular polysaccharide biosynthesis acetyltransferase n=1 Tax=Desertivirga xinjiangensis TaxID=539206 RepID=UPI00210D3A0C|nr:WcaF family extracellular polysaccharide biosynthesis acetyltransferase [Pedobacter xinjiangensis]
MMNKTDLSQYNNSWYTPKASSLKRLLWIWVNAAFLKTSFIPSSGIRVFLLKLFGAKIGVGVNIKPGISVKYPWLLSVGNYAWLGEDVWIDNLVETVIGDNACLSQGAMLLTGNHNFKKTTFDLIVGGITLEEGVWIGAKATVCPGVTCKSHSVLSVGSVATKDLEPYSIYQGNPAVKVRDRALES